MAHLTESEEITEKQTASPCLHTQTCIFIYVLFSLRPDGIWWKAYWLLPHFFHPLQCFPAKHCKPLTCVKEASPLLKTKSGCSNHASQGQSTAGRRNGEKPITVDILPTMLASVTPGKSAYPSNVSLGLSLEKRRMRTEGWITHLSHNEFHSIYHAVSKRHYLSWIRCSKTRRTCPKTNVRFEVVWICTRAGFSGEEEVSGIIPHLGPWTGPS